MAYRANIVKMLETLVTQLESNHFNIKSSMKQEFVAFVNDFFRNHLGREDASFVMNQTLLMATAGNVHVIIASDNTRALEIPGCSIPMRDTVEAFIVVDGVVAYDSYKMRVFRRPPKTLQETPDPKPTPLVNTLQTPDPLPPVSSSLTNAVQPPNPPPVIANAVQSPSTAPAIANAFQAPASPPATSSFNFPTSPGPSTFAFPAKPATPAATSGFSLPAAFSSPTNLFAAR
jgi:hypothetical protein